MLSYYVLTCTAAHRARWRPGRTCVGSRVHRRTCRCMCKGRSIGDFGRSARPHRSLPLGPARPGGPCRVHSASQEARAASGGTAATALSAGWSWCVTRGYGLYHIWLQAAARDDQSEEAVCEDEELGGAKEPICIHTIHVCMCTRVHVLVYVYAPWAQKGRRRRGPWARARGHRRHSLSSAAEGALFGPTRQPPQPLQASGAATAAIICLWGSQRSHPRPVGRPQSLRVSHV